MKSFGIGKKKKKEYCQSPYQDGKKSISMDSHDHNNWNESVFWDRHY